MTILTAAGSETVSEQDGKLEVKNGETSVFTWQVAPLENPVGGPKFAASAFLHQLRTPAGFEWTAIQPEDHLHHFGLWWPWKYIEVNGEKHNCWEIQEGQGRLVARSAKPLPATPGSLAWELSNTTEILTSGSNPQPAILETSTVSLCNEETAQIIDIEINQKAARLPVTISSYRYSGFSWRGPISWNKENSRMITSEGFDRDSANGKPARWIVVTGPTPTGSASVLIMSAAAELAGKPEQLRVWDSKTHNGMPFVNFNPVMEQSLPLDEAHPAVSKRKYRVVASDQEIAASDAESAWQKWMGK